MSDARSRAYETVESDAERLVETCHAIWETPELGLHEHESSATLVEVLEDAGFEVETGIGDMPTAFVAEYGDGDPVIGILGEFDALPGLSQHVSAERDPIEPNGPGHGCGHNLYGTAAAWGAIGAAAAIDAGEVEGTVRCYGCPAEETLVGKVFMAREGAFDDLDAAITWHPGDLTSPKRGSSLALDSIQFRFEGTAAHAGGSPESGRSALDGVELLNAGVERMREHVPEKARIHYSITDGGGAPNVVPPEAEVWYFVRAPDRAEVDRLTEWVTDISEAAAKMTRTEVERRYITGCYDFLVNDAVTDVIETNLEAAGPIEFDDEERAFAAELRETYEEERMEDRLEKYPEEVAAEIEGEPFYGAPLPATDEGEVSGGSTDVGDVSWIVPTAQFRMATWPVGTPAHSWQAVAANGRTGPTGAVTAAKVLAGTTVDLMADEETLERAHEEFADAAGDAYENTLPEDAEPPFDVTVGE